MTIEKLFKMNNKYSSITIEEQEDKTFKATCLIWNGKNNVRKTLKFSSLDDYKNYLSEFKIEFSSKNTLYACLKLNGKDNFYINIYLLLKYHIC